MVKLKGSLSDIGVVKKSKISDGYDTFDCEVVDLGKVLLIHVNETFYLDDKIDLKRLDKQGVLCYNLGSYFDVVEEVTPTTQRKRRVKK